MKLLSAACAALSVLVAASSATAQPGTADFEAMFAKKLESEFLKKASWSTDFVAACKKAKESDQVLLAYFTRSYAP